MKPFSVVTSRAVLLERDDIDTDQIIPARFLTTTSRNGMGRHLFADWRFDATGAARSEFPLNAVSAAGAHILVAGRNFGCGSSREHAPWALADWGFRVVIASSFADIFRSNAYKSGLLTVQLEQLALDEVHALLQRLPDTSLVVDLAAQTISVGGDWSVSFGIDPFAKRCLIDGANELDLLLGVCDDIQRYESQRARSDIRTEGRAWKP